MRPVRFTRSIQWGQTGYLANEVAGFPDDVAARFVAAGCAVYADGAPTSEAAPKADTVNPSPSTTSETGAASTLATLGSASEERNPDPKREREALLADSVSRTNRRDRHRR